MTTNTLFWAALVAFAIGSVGGMIPWQTSRLPPVSVRRRFYWAGSAIAIVLFFLAGLPDWRSSIFMACAVALGLVAIAFSWTSHIKIGNRIWAAYHSLRRPDPPPTTPSTDET